MKLFAGIITVVVMSTASLGNTEPRSYWFLMNDDQTWCGYTDEKKFQIKADEVKPLESARLTLVSGRPSEITYEVQSESGDWILSDKYSIRPGAMKIKRTTIFDQNSIQVIQEVDVHAGTTSPLKIISVKSLDGSPADSEALYYPDLPIKTSISEFPFTSLAQTMSKKSLSFLCSKVARH